MAPLAAGAVSGTAKQSLPEGMAPVTRPTKLFIGGITRNTTTKQLRDHFSAYGRVLDCVAMRQPDGRPRGFGYVTLDSPQAAELCLAQPQVIDGRVVDMKRAVPEGDMDSAPTTRLHVPGAARVQPPGLVQGGGFGMERVAGLQSGRAPNSWLPSGLSAGVGVPSRVGVGPAGVGGGVTPQVWSGLQSAPDCLELLSRSELPDTPRCAKDQIKAGLLSASAPEFVPQPALPALRPALGEITNMVHRQDDLKKVLAPVKPIPRSPDLQINTDAIFEDGSTDSNPSPPGLCRENQCDLADLKVLGTLPSLGSLEHASGTCKRCNFYPKGRCQNGQSCTFCHLSHDRRKASRSERKARLTDPTTPSTDEEIFLGLPEVSPVPPLLPFGQAVVPPPGLTSLLATQPVTPVWMDEDLELPIPSPLGSTFMNPLSLTSTGCLATVPMTNPVAPPSSPMTVLLQSHLEEVDRKVMVRTVTMATQTGEECDSECGIPRERLLQHRWSVSGPSSLGIRTEKISEETPGAV